MSDETNLENNAPYQTETSFKSLLSFIIHLNLSHFSKLTGKPGQGMFSFNGSPLEHNGNPKFESRECPDEHQRQKDEEIKEECSFSKNIFPYILIYYKLDQLTYLSFKFGFNDNNNNNNYYYYNNGLDQL